MEKDENGNFIEHCNRGYEVTNDSFYVYDNVYRYEDGKPLIDTEGNQIIRHKEQSFNDFGDYYSYLEGDIYTKACYLGWNPDRSLIKEYKIDEEKLNRESLNVDCIYNHTWSIDEEIKTIKSNRVIREKYLKAMLKRLTKCKEPDDIDKALAYCEKKTKAGNHRDINLILSMYFEMSEIAEKLLLKRIKQDCIDDYVVYYILAYCKKPLAVAKAFEPFAFSDNSYHRDKKRALSAAMAFADFDNHIVNSRAYYDEGGLFVVATEIMADDGECYTRYKTFNDFYDFANYLNKDLSGIDLSECILNGIFNGMYFYAKHSNACHYISGHTPSFLVITIHTYSNLCQYTPRLW